jgi:molybdopterin converting factor small subunit
MPTLRIPAPLRAYTGGKTEIDVEGKTVAEALDSLVAAHPALRQHVFDGRGELRPFVNLFLNSEDVRHLNGLETSLAESDRLMIVPSIAGGLSTVDHSALRTNQALIIGLSLAAFVFDLPWLAGLVALVMAIGTALGIPGFSILYRRVLRPLGWVRPDLIRDNPEPHRFAQGMGAAVLAIGVILLYAGAAVAGWALVWVVIALAALNLFAGFCAGCAVYYWLNRLAVPGFVQSPPEGTFPGKRPDAEA